MTVIKIFKIIIILFLVLNLSILIAGYGIYKSDINNLNIKTEQKLEILSRKSNELEQLLNIEKNSYRDKKAQYLELQSDYELLNTQLSVTQNSSKSSLEIKQTLQTQSDTLSSEIKSLKSDINYLNGQLEAQLLAQRSTTSSAS